ncbi:MAG TPA: hypothetical protein PLJ78_04445 [Anaerolineae bacterium]|nr:hypothetical protein [Anaerolineae bacterium]HQK13182.1 hypothetical protein [Anaerolineae bacterium]
MKKLGNVHPLLFAVYPVLFIAVYNWSLVSFKQMIVPLLVVLAFACLCWLGMQVLLKDKTKASIGASVFLIFFFSYGRLYILTQNVLIAGIDIGQHKYIFPFWIVALALCFFLLLRVRFDLRGVADFLNIMAAVLVGFTLVTAGYNAVNSRLANARPATETVSLQQDRQPDIYYIILDGCARADILAELYDLDIAPFLDTMTQKGFFVASRSRTNYSQTQLSLASSLNFTYLDDLAAQMSAESGNRLPLKQMIHNNRVASSLQQKGYMFVAFATEMEHTDIKNADRYLTDSWSLSEFDNIVLNTTPLPGLLNRVLSRSVNFQYDAHRHKILYPLEHLENIARYDVPTFTFAHIMACHPPFVFDEDGQPVNPSQDFALLDGNFFVSRYGKDAYVSGYRKQLTFILSRVEEAIDRVLATSPEPPIIILQADHGGGSGLDFSSLEKTDIHERMAILNLYYLPDGGAEHLYDEITPVNTFRVVLNYYFGAELNLLEDKSYYSPIDFPYQFTDVTDSSK